MDIPKIHEGEYRFCLIMWEHEPVTAAELVKLCQEQLGWKRTTTYTVIKRLGEKGVLQNDNGTITSLVSKDAVQAYEIGELVEKTFEGSLPVFENYKHEHISKLACPGCAAAPVCLEESPQVGQCPALGHCGSASGFSVLYRERSESDSQRRDSSDGYRNGSTAHDQQRCSSDQ